MYTNSDSVVLEVDTETTDAEKILEEQTPLCLYVVTNVVMK